MADPVQDVKRRNGANSASLLHLHHQNEVRHVAPDEDAAPSGLTGIQLRERLRHARRAARLEKRLHVLMTVRVPGKTKKLKGWAVKVAMTMLALETAKHMRDAINPHNHPED